VASSGALASGAAVDLVLAVLAVEAVASSGALASGAAVARRCPVARRRR
jgi:hypothetical protein